MKILLLGEYSNVHATLARGLRNLGHEVTVVSNGDFWKDYPRDIDVSRKSGPFSGVRLYLEGSVRFCHGSPDSMSYNSSIQYSSNCAPTDYSPSIII